MSSTSPQLGIQGPTGSDEASMQFVLRTSSLNLFILLSCSWGTSCSSGWTTDDWETRTHTRDEHESFSALGIKMVSYLFGFAFAFTPLYLLQTKKNKKDVMWCSSLRTLQRMWRISQETEWNVVGSVLGSLSSGWRNAFLRASAPSSAAGKSITHQHLWDASRLMQNGLDRWNQLCEDQFSSMKMFCLEDYCIRTSGILLHKGYFVFKTEHMEQDNRGHKKWPTCHWSWKMGLKYIFSKCKDVKQKEMKVLFETWDSPIVSF